MHDPSLDRSLPYYMAKTKEEKEAEERQGEEELARFCR
jgi:hypothetical protein